MKRDSTLNFLALAYASKWKMKWDVCVNGADLGTCRCRKTNKVTLLKSPFGALQAQCKTGVRPCQTLRNTIRPFNELARAPYLKLQKGKYVNKLPQ